MNNDENDTGIVFLNETNKYEYMQKKDIIEGSMKKVYNHLKDFYKEIINNNTEDLSVSSLENELKLFEIKYLNFLKSDSAKNIVNHAFSKLYNQSRDTAENKYIDFVTNNNNENLIDEY